MHNNNLTLFYQFKIISWSQIIYIFAPGVPPNPMQQITKNLLQQDIKKEFTNFIVHYDDGSYYEKIKDLLNTGKIMNNFCLKNQDLMNYNCELAMTIFDQFYKYQKVLNNAFTQIVKVVSRQQGYVQDQNNRQDTPNKYTICFQSGIGGSNQQNIGIRDLVCSKIGKLESLIGTITRTTQVRPQLIEGVFKCKNCNKLSEKIQQQFKYTEPKKCLNVNCDTKAWQLDLHMSQFSDFQQLRVQEDPNSIPAGGMPRSINIILRDSNVEKAQPGDICKFVGYLCVVPEISSMLKPGQRTTLTTRNLQTRGNMMEMDGVKGITGIRQLNYKLMFVANNVIVQNKQYHDVDTNLDQQQQVMPQQSPQNENKAMYSSDQIFKKILQQYGQSEMNEIRQLRQNPRLYEDMADSLFPGIFGHSQIKKAILLQLLGGVHKVTNKTKIGIRGDINLLIVGDPSTAKSQFLKAVNKFVTRSVYTNGKTTSAAGLTASVMRDDQGNVGIEAGALMLADNGVCCIDQFDKMNLSDITAIHEAMQQQTISIAKAGVHATLNARTSILAAANPIFGRYDKTKNLQKNINISAPIMSRFDLYFVICDQSNLQADNNLCQFIINMHRQKDRALNKKYSTKTLRFYISVAKKFKPRLSNEAAKKLRQCYIILRQSCKILGGGASYLATVRQLQSMIRLSEALAKLHLQLEVTEDHVNQAFRLIQSSITKLQKADIEIEQEPEGKQNKVQQIINQQYKKKKQQKKEKKITLSSEAYDDIIKNVLQIFKKQKLIRKQSDMQLQNEIKLTQGNIINYIVSIQFEKGTINTEEEEKNFRKIARGVIKKMIKEQRMLMVVEEPSKDENQRVLKLHSNFLMNSQYN